MPRPPVDIVVPFAGTAAELAALVARLDALVLAPGDRVTVADNRPGGPGSAGEHVRVIAAGGKRSSYFARNHGAARGTNPWIVFLDADVELAGDLLEAYFDPPPQERTGVLAGGIRDEAGEDPVVSGVARHASLGHDVTLDRERPYAQTANCAVRRAAFAAVGGFDETIRSAGDADLCFRLDREGWGLEARPRALVVHRSRRTLRALARQKARHGAGVAWLGRRWPGAVPAAPPRAVVAHLLRELVPVGRSLLRRDRAGVRAALVSPVVIVAFSVGRLLPNRAR